jgi:hypothetical protein
MPFEFSEMAISNTLALSSTIIKGEAIVLLTNQLLDHIDNNSCDFLWRDNHTVRTAFKAEKFLSRALVWLSFLTNPSRNFRLFSLISFIFPHKNS